VIRVLVVDDFEPWRHFAASNLQTQPGLQIVGEASDGVDAVQKAQELQPDLILMDIGLPSLNGIEAARRIREKVPDAKVVFCSEHRSWDIVEEGIRTAAGYVLKSAAGKDLLPAVAAVLRGEQFLSSTLIKPNPDANKERVPNKPGSQKLLAHLPPQNVVIRHEIEFYPDDTALVDGFARVVEAVLNAGNAAIVVASEFHRAEILSRLKADRVDVDAARKQRKYIELDVDQTLAAIMLNDMPDSLLCSEWVGDVIATAKGAQKDPLRIAICGECAPTLLARGNTEGAIQLEHLWDKLTKEHGTDTLCGYIPNAVEQKESSSVLSRICAEHSAVQGRELGYLTRSR
jgi:DNA-binding NarL/FixJ family response regulator